MEFGWIDLRETVIFVRRLLLLTVCNGGLFLEPSEINHALSIPIGALSCGLRGAGGEVIPIPPAQAPAKLSSAAAIPAWPSSRTRCRVLEVIPCVHAAIPAPQLAGEMSITCDRI